MNSASVQLALRPLLRHRNRTKVTLLVGESECGSPFDFPMISRKHLRAFFTDTLGPLPVMLRQRDLKRLVRKPSQLSFVL